MFDPRDIADDPRRRTPEKPKRDRLKERQERKRTREPGPSSIRDPTARVSRAAPSGPWRRSACIEAWPTRIYRRRILTDTPTPHAGRWTG